MATPIRIEKQPLVIAATDPSICDKLEKRNTSFTAYLRMIKAYAEMDPGRMPPLRSNKMDLEFLLDNYAVAKSSGLWLMFKPEVEKIIDREKNRYYQPIKYIIADIPEGMTKVGSGKVMIAVANSECSHLEILMILRNAAAYENDLSPRAIGIDGDALAPRTFMIPNKGNATLLGGGALEYVYRKETPEFELFIDQNIFSSAYHSAPPSVLLEVIARINGCEGVSIKYGCYGTGEDESKRLMMQLEAMARAQ